MTPLEIVAAAVTALLGAWSATLRWSLARLVAEVDSLKPLVDRITRQEERCHGHGVWLSRVETLIERLDVKMDKLLERRERRANDRTTKDDE